MPIEIRELVIRAAVNPAETAGCAAPSSSAAAQSDSQTQTRSQDDPVQVCIREVLRILEERRER